MTVNTIQARPRLISVDEYEQMIQAGVFPEDDRIELIDGQIINMSPIGASHAGHVNRLVRLFSAQTGGQALLSVQNPIRLPGSEPQPDLALLRPRPDDYASGHPSPRDVLLVIEVMDSSADFDRSVKVPLYGRSGVPEVWLIDLDRTTVEVHRGPNPAGYDEKRTYGAGDQLVPQTLPGAKLAVAEILGVEV